MYGLLCHVHIMRSRFNKHSKINCEPSIHYKRSAFFISKANRHPGGKKSPRPCTVNWAPWNLSSWTRAKKVPLAQQHKADQEKVDKVTFNAMQSAYLLAHEEAEVLIKSRRTARPSRNEWLEKHKGVVSKRTEIATADSLLERMNNKRLLVPFSL